MALAVRKAGEDTQRHPDGLAPLAGDGRELLSPPAVGSPSGNEGSRMMSANGSIESLLLKIHCTENNTHFRS